MSKIHQTSDSAVFPHGNSRKVTPAPTGTRKKWLPFLPQESIHFFSRTRGFPAGIFRSRSRAGLYCTVPASQTSLLRAPLLLRDPTLKVRTHASLGQLCYVNEVNKRPADGRVSELAPLAVPQLAGAVQ